VLLFLASQAIGRFAFHPVPGGIISIGRTNWRVEERREALVDPTNPELGSGRTEVVRILRNDRQVFVDDKGSYNRAKVVQTPAPFPVVAIRETSGAGHGERTLLGGLRRGRAVRMVDISWGEAGGPIFKDLDGDGKPEWIWDDYSWYEYFHHAPGFWIAYRLGRDGKLRRWRKLRNPTGTALPRTFGQEFP